MGQAILPICLMAAI